VPQNEQSSPIRCGGASGWVGVCPEHVTMPWILREELFYRKMFGEKGWGP
jgi:hypothetical protein